jgi:low temperature requirement protein LtrA
MVTNVLRGSDERVGFAELFYDLVFVFAITQVSHLLLHHYTLAGAAETLLLLLAVWWVWVYTTWVTNRLDPDQLRVRALLFLMMAAGLFLSMAIPQAFGARGLVFAVAYSAMQIGRTLFVRASAGDDPVLRRTFGRMLIWFLVSAVFWIGGGLADHEARLALWGIALVLDYLGPLTGFHVPGAGRDASSDWAVRGGHMAERFGLFVIICLGETLLVSGATFAEVEWSAAPTLAFLGAVAGTIGMWWVYFHIGHRRGTHQIEHAADPGRLARLAFTYLHFPIVAGVVLSAVGSELAIAHPDGHAHWPEVAALVGGVALFLGGNGLFKWVSAPNFPLSHMIGLGLCVVLAAISPWLLLWQVNALAAAVLAVVAVWESRSWSAGPREG